MSLSFQEIVKLMRMIEAGSCQELVLESEGLKLVIRRGAGTGDPAPEADAEAGLNETEAAPAEQPTDRGDAPARPPRSDGGIEIRAPMVGTFYRAPSPDAPPFVELDSEVEPGDPLCVIEVMKLFTTIEAGTAGRVAEIAPANEELIEYDALLFVIEPRAVAD